jgi:diguanylate cyclase
VRRAARGRGEGLGLDPHSWWPLGVLALAAGLACGLRAALTRSERIVWGLLALGMTSSGAGWITWAALYEHQASPPYPSVADALWVPYFVLLPGALAALVRSERPHIPPTACWTR